MNISIRGSGQLGDRPIKEVEGSIILAWQPARPGTVELDIHTGALAFSITLNMKYNGRGPWESKSCGQSPSLDSTILRNLLYLLVRKAHDAS